MGRSAATYPHETEPGGMASDSGGHYWQHFEPSLSSPRSGNGTSSSWQTGVENVRIMASGRTQCGRPAWI